MKNANQAPGLLRSRSFSFAFMLVTYCILLLMPGWARGQTVQVRKYASNQKVNAGLLTSVDNPSRAADGNPRTHSTINRLLGVGNLITVTQFLEFDTQQAAGTPVTVKLSLPSSLLSLIGGVEIQPFTNLNNDFHLLLNPLSQWQADATGKAYVGNELLGLLNGAGDMEVTIVPQTNGGASVAYQGVWVKLQGIAVGQSLDLFHAFVKEDGTLACDEKDKAIDVLSGVRAGGLSIANATGTVTDPWNVIDGDVSTSALMSTGIQVLSEVYHTTIFQTPSRPNQVAKVVMQGTTTGLGGLLDLSLLSGLTIQPYLGSTPVGTPLNNSTLLSLRLFPGKTDIFELNVPVSGSFDRIEIKMGGVAGVLNSLRIYEVGRLPELPVVGNTLNAKNEVITCAGTPAVLNATAPNGNTINWYTSETGGTAVTGPTYTTAPVTGPVTYYVSSTPAGCTVESPRIPVKVNVNSYPAIALEGELIYSLPIGSLFALPTAIAKNEDGSSATVVWKDPSGAAVSGNITVPNTIGTFTYRVEATGNDALACTNFKTITITTYDPNTCPNVFLRNYATSETHTTSNLLGLVQLGQVNNPDRAIDGGVNSYSELIEPLNVAALFGETTQTLSWASPVAAGTPVTIKLAKDYSAASLLGGMFVVGVDAGGNEIGPRLLAAPQILAAVNGVNVFEYTFIPADGAAVAQPYKGVKVILSAVANVLQTARVYDAYYHQTVSNFGGSCPTGTVTDIYGGYVLPIAGLNAATSLLNVENAEHAVDGNPANYANMINGVGALAFSKLDVTFSTPALFGDTLTIQLDRPGAPLLDLSLLSGVQIQRFLGNKAIGEPVLNTSNLLTLNLLGGGSSQANLVMVADQPFDRVQILYGGLASVLQNLHVYDIRVTANTSITGEDKDGNGNNLGTIEICEGETLTLPETDCAKLALYTDATGSTQVNLEDLKTLAPGTYTYYIQGQRFGCDVSGERRVITAIINPTSASLITGITVAGITDNCVDPAGNVTLTAQLSSTPANVVYQWYSDNAGTPELMAGETASTLALANVAAGTHTYYVSVVADGYCAAAPTPVSFTGNPKATDTDINLSSAVFQCIGQDVVLTPTSATVSNPTFRWYADAAKTTTITVGVDANGVLTVVGLGAGTYEYYVTVSGDNKCENVGAKKIEVTVGNSPPAPTFTAANVTLCGPGDAVFEVNNSAGGLTYELFTDDAGVNPVPAGDYNVSGTKITIPSTGNATYYVKASGSCASATLGKIIVTVNAVVPSANISVTGTGPICAGTKTALTASLTGGTVSNPVFHWYSDATLSTKVHTGATFDVTPTITTNYYVTVSGDGVCENLADVKVVTVAVNPVPQITLSGSATIGVSLGTDFTLPTITVDPLGTTVAVTETTGGMNTPITDPTLAINKGIGTYTYLVTASNGTCLSSVTITVSVTDPAACPPGFNRVYNNGQSFDTSLLGSISNPTAAADQNPATYSILTEGINALGLLGGNYQDLEWSGAAIPAGTSVTVKLGKDFNLVALAGGIRVVGINAANQEIGLPILVDGSLVSALGGNNNFEYTFAPTQAYKAVRVYVNGLVSVGQNARIYGAYYHKAIDANNPIVCSEKDVRDVITGVEPVLLGGLTDIATTLVNVTGANNAVDNDLNSYAELKNNAGVDAYAKLDIAFSTPSLNGDTLRIIAGIPTGGLLDVGLLGGMKFQRYLGNVAVGAPILGTSSLLDVSLLPGSTQRNIIIYAAIDGAFDRIKILYGGVADVALLSGKALRVYDVDRKAPTKIVGSNPDNSITICQGGTIAFPPASCNTTYRIYDALVGGNLIAEGPDFEGIKTLAGGTYTLYIQPVRQGCESMDRTAFKLAVNASPLAPVVTDTEVCQTAVSATVNYDVVALQGHTLVYYADATTTTPLGTVPTADSQTVGTTTVYVAQINTTTGCESPRVAVNIVVNSTATITDIADILVNGMDPSAPLCIVPNVDVILTTSLTAGSTITNPVFHWYAEDGTAITGGTDGTLNIGKLNVGTYTYSVGVSGDGFCESLASDRKTVTFTILPTGKISDIANILVNGMDPSAPLCIAPNVDVILTTGLTAGSTITNPVFHWYNEAGVAISGGTNGTLNIGKLAAGTYTYSVGVSGDGVCESLASDRKTVTFTILPTGKVTDIADIMVNGMDPSAPLCIAPNVDVILTTGLTAGSTITNPVFHWYNEAGVAISGGTNGTLNIGKLAAGTYTYSVGVSGDGVCESLASDRKTVTFIILPTGKVPDIADILVNGMDPSAPLCIAPNVDVILTTGLVAGSTITNPVFHWYNEAGVAISGGTNGTLNIGKLAAGTYTYSVGVSGDGVCESLASDRKTVTFTILPTGKVTDIADIMVNGMDPSAPLCIAPNVDVILTTALTAGSTITNPVFHWYNEAGVAISGGTNGTLNIGKLAAGTYTYSVGVSGDGVCESLASDRKTVTFIILPTGKVTDIADILVNGMDPSSSICIEPTDETILTASLSATSTIKNPIFHWYDASGMSVGNSSTGVLNLGIKVPGTYTYSVGVSGDGVCESLVADRKVVTFTTVYCRSAISVTKVSDKDRVVAGEAITFTVTLKNEGPAAIEVGRELDLLERPSTGLSITGYAVNSGNATIAANGMKAVVTTTAAIPVNGTVVVKITTQVDADAPATISNGITVWGPDKDPGADPEDDKDDTPPIPVDRESNLSIVKKSDQTRVKAGENTTFTLTITNDGPSTIDIGKKIQLTERPGAGVTIDKYEIIGTNATVNGTANNATVTTTAKIAQGQTIVVKVTAKVDADAPTTITNGITVWGPDKDPGTDPEDDEDDTPPIPVDRDYNLTIEKIADEARVKEGETTTFTVTITNNGPSVMEIGKDIKLTERPSAGVTIEKYEIIGNNATISGSGNKATVTTTAKLALSGTITVKITAKIDDEAPEKITNGISVWRPGKPDTEDPDDEDDTPEIPVDYPLIQAVDDIAETKAAIPVTVDVLANDIVTKWDIVPASIEVVASSAGAQLNVEMDGKVTYTSSRDMIGEDTFTYRVKDVKGRWSNTATVRVAVASNDLDIPNIITPNGDGKNDVFRIKGIELYDRVALTIVNRWGNEVYKSNTYNNDWGGLGLSEGTYFYVLELLKGGKVEVHKGWVTIKSN